MLFDIFCKNKPKYHHIKNLIALAKVDGFFHLNEYEFLLVVARKHGLSTSLIQRIEKDTSQKDFKLPKEPLERFHYWYDLVNMVLADNVIHEKELDFCASVAQNFGYPQHIVEKTIEKIRQGESYEKVYEAFVQEKYIDDVL
jgi:hypothetical protein